MITLGLALVVLMLMGYTANRTVFLSIETNRTSVDQLSLGVASGSLFLKRIEGSTSAPSPSSEGAEWSIFRLPVIDQAPLRIVLPLWLPFLVLTFFLVAYSRQGSPQT